MSSRVWECPSEAGNVHPAPTTPITPGWEAPAFPSPAIPTPSPFPAPRALGFRGHFGICCPAGIPGAVLPVFQAPAFPWLAPSGNGAPPLPTASRTRSPSVAPDPSPTSRPGRGQARDRAPECRRCFPGSGRNTGSGGMNPGASSPPLALLGSRGLFGTLRPPAHPRSRDLLPAMEPLPAQLPRLIPAVVPGLDGAGHVPGAPENSWSCSCQTNPGGSGTALLQG